MNHIVDLAMAACGRVGIEFKHVPADGRWHVVNIRDDRKGKGAGRLRLFPDGQGGAAWNHKTKAYEQFFLNQTTVLSKQDREQIEREQRKREQDRQRKADNAARKAGVIFNSAKPVVSQNDHPYLIEKNIIPPPGLLKTGTWKKSIKDDESGQWLELVIKNALIVPMFDERARLKSLQAIFPKKIERLNGRNKDFLAGGQSYGLFAWVGKKTDSVCVYEGLATALSVYEATGSRAYAAFSAGNLEPVAQIVRKHLPAAKIIICGDNDESGTGQREANKAAQAIGGHACIPPEIGDWNDFVNRETA